MQDWLRAHDVSVVVISFAPVETLRFYQTQFEWPFAILADPDRRLYQQFQLRRLPWRRLFGWRPMRKYWKLIREGRKLRRFGKDDIYQAGGDFLIDRNGEVGFEFRSHDPSDRPTLEQIRQAVGE